jgi:hypothetical protein
MSGARGANSMRAIVSGIYRIILGGFPVIDLPGKNSGMLLGPRESLLRDLRLSSPATEILDFGENSARQAGERRPLRNHFPGAAGPGLAGDPGRAMLLGHKDDSLMLKHKDAQFHGPEIARGLY